MDKDEEKLLKEMMGINMFYSIFTKYANKFYPFDFGWKRYFKNISKFFYFRKMRKEIRNTVNRSTLYDLIIDWLGLITYCKNTQGDEYEKFRLYNTKMNNGNNYSYSLVESENKKEVEYLENILLSIVLTRYFSSPYVCLTLSCRFFFLKESK